MMNAIERMKALIQGDDVDRVGVSGWVHMPMVDRNIKDFTKATIDFTDNNGYDFVKVMYNGHFMTEAFGADIDFSKDPTQWSGEINRYPLAHPQDFADLKTPEIDCCSLKREVEITRGVAEHYKGEMPVLATVFTPLTCLQEMLSSTKPAGIQKMMLHSKKELHHALEVLTETNIRFLEKLIEAGIDGIFYATQYACSHLITKEQHDEFARPYDLRVLEAIQGKTWFNMLHIHGNENLMFEELADYPVHAFNWEDVGVCEQTRASIAHVRSLTDKLLICGIDQHHDFYNAGNDREAIKATLKRRLEQALADCGDRKLVFAPGCALPMDVDRYVFALMQEVVKEAAFA